MMKEDTALFTATENIFNDAAAAGRSSGQGRRLGTDCTAGKRHKNPTSRGGYAFYKQVDNNKLCVKVLIMTPIGAPLVTIWSIIGSHL